MHCYQLSLFKCVGMMQDQKTLIEFRYKMPMLSFTRKL